jgi:hypothetical protein
MVKTNFKDNKNKNKDARGKTIEEGQAINSTQHSLPAAAGGPALAFGKCLALVNVSCQAKRPPSHFLTPSTSGKLKRFVCNVLALKPRARASQKDKREVKPMPNQDKIRRRPAPSNSHSRQT